MASTRQRDARRQAGQGQGQRQDGMAAPAPQRKRAVFSLGPVLQQLEAVSLNDEGPGAKSPNTGGKPTRDGTADASASPPLVGGASSASSPPASSWRSPPPASSASPSPSPASSRGPFSPSPTAAPTAASAAAPNSSRFSQSPPAPTAGTQARYSQSPPAAAYRPSQSPPASGHRFSPSPPAGSTSASAAVKSSFAASSSSSGSRVGLVIDHARQAAIDAAFQSAGLNIGLSGGQAVDQARVVEVYDLPPSLTGPQITQMLPGALTTHFVDEQRVLVVFANEIQARDAAAGNHPQLKIRPLRQASDESRAQAAQLVAPTAARPATDNRAANRLLAGALGIRMPRMTPEQREEEQKKREERRKAQDAARSKREAEAQGDSWED